MTHSELGEVIAEGQRVRGQARRPERTTAPRWRLRAEASAAGAPADLYLYDVIGWPGIEAGAVVAELRSLGARPLRVHLNSSGGDVFDGLAIYNTFQHHPAPVAVHVEGLAASIASVIAMGGASLSMAAASLLMIHEPHALVMGPAGDMRHMAELLDKTAGLMADVYARRGADRTQIRHWMYDETWFSASDAREARLIDTIDAGALPDEAAAAWAAFDLSGFRRPPAAPAPPPPRPSPRAREYARIAAHGFELLAGAGAPAQKE
jgi:ATP-dependent protease ClpP protease subunit